MDQKLIMNFINLRQYYKLISFRSLHRRSCIIPKSCTCDKSLKVISRMVHSLHSNLQKNIVKVQPSLEFSTSIYLNSDMDTISENDKKSLNVSYNELLKAQKDNSVLIIDVREKEEIDETGKLPGSIHIPMVDVANTLLSLSKEDFKQRFNKEKPSKDTKIILSCRSGRRSGIVQEEIQKLGYENAYNYVGGWLEWENNQKV